MVEIPQSGSSQPETRPADRPAAEPTGRRSRRFFLLALLLLYLAAVFPRLRAAGFDAPDMTYGDERWTAGQAAEFLSNPNGRISRFHKAPGIPHFLVFTFKPYYWLVKNHFGWNSVHDVQWWRARQFWRSLNILIGSLTVILAGVLGARAFNRRVGLLAAAFCASSTRCAIWFTFMKEEALMTLACAIVIYCAWKVLTAGTPRMRWVWLAGVASGSAVAFKYNAAPIVPTFLLALLIQPIASGDDGWKPSNWFSRPRLAGAALYLSATVATFLLWFPQLILRPHDVWRSLSTLDQFTSLNVAAKPLPPLGAWLWTAGESWACVFYAWQSADNHPFYFFALTTAILFVVPVHAVKRRNGFLLVLSSFVWLMYLSVYHQWLFSGWKMNHYFVPAIVATYLLVAYGVDRLCERLAPSVARRASLPRPTAHLALLVLLCAWPVVQAYAVSLHTLDDIRGDSAARATRREIVNNLPVGSKIFITRIWRQPHVSASLLDVVQLPSLFRDLCANYSFDDLVRQGFDYACVMNDEPKAAERKARYFTEMLVKNIQPAFTFPRVSCWLSSFSYVPLQPGDGASFHLGLFFAEPFPGDFAGVRGVLPPLPRADAGPDSHSLILKARLFNRHQWLARFIRWDVRVDGSTLWHGRDTTESKNAVLYLPFRARSGSEIVFRTMRTDFRPEAAWGWGGGPSDLTIDGLSVLDAATSKPVEVRWSYIGCNGGPGPARYSMRGDWLHNESAPALRDPGFEGRLPLVEAWRPYQIVEPAKYEDFPQAAQCRKMARIEPAPKLGPDGSNALRFVVGYPPKQSATLGVMQPIACPDSQHIGTIRVHYRADGAAANRGDFDLRLTATALGLSGEFVDRAVVGAPLVRVPDTWGILELDVAGTWRRKHTRVDLIEFLEVAIEATAGPDAVFNYLLDNVELELSPKGG